MNHHIYVFIQNPKVPKSEFSSFVHTTMTKDLICEERTLKIILLQRIFIQLTNKSDFSS